MRYFRYFGPVVMSETRAMCDLVGIALIGFVFLFAFFICPAFPALAAAFFVHAPAPVSRTVSQPDRKSAMPAAVEMPAPVKAQKCLDPLMRAASFWILV